MIRTNLTIFIFSCIALSSCKKSTLEVKSEYFSRSSLASSVVDTPDPRKTGDAFGQRLVISWNVTQKEFDSSPISLVVHIKLKNGEIVTTKIDLSKREGSTFYPIFGKDFTKKGGLQSYLVELKSNKKTISICKHKLWVDKLNIS